MVSSSYRTGIHTDFQAGAHENTYKNGETYRYRVCFKEIVTFKPYEVTYGETVTSDTYTFTTLDDRKDNVSFIVLNDIHEQNETLIAVTKLAQTQPFDLVFLNGDILGHIENQQQIIDHVLAPCTESLATRTPFVYVRGTHETRGKFARRLPDYVALPDGRYYCSFDHGSVHFVVMDGGEDKRDTDKEYSGLVDFDRYRAVQRKWLEAEIWPPVEGQCDYPTIIGGAPQKGAATVIRVDATADHLGVTMTRDDGQIVGTYTIHRIKADSPAVP